MLLFVFLVGLRYRVALLPFKRTSSHVGWPGNKFRSHESLLKLGNLHGRFELQIRSVVVSLVGLGVELSLLPFKRTSSHAWWPGNKFLSHESSFPLGTLHGRLLC